MRRLVLGVLPLLTTGCLSREIDAYIDGLVATSSGGMTTGVSTTGRGSSSGDEEDGSASAAGETASGVSDAGTETTASTGGGSESDAGSTSPAPAVCGDGIEDGDEECDDGNDVPDDGCSNSCAVDLRVFVTSIGYKAGELMGPYLADAICLNRAKDAGLPEYQRFKAWLSSSEEDARDRFNRARRGRLVMVNGLVLAADWEALLAGQLENPLEVTETSETFHGAVWTGTKADGTAAAGTDHCLDWTTSSVTHDGYYGYSDEISFEWTLADQNDNPLPCIDPLRIYCFESF